MDSTFETSFIPEAINKAPFADKPAQKFFSKWCEINDSIDPQFISREDYQKRAGQGILKKNDNGTQTLYLPNDLHLWEMMDVIRTVDHDTLSRNPERGDERAEKIKELGKDFENAGLYLTEYLPFIDESGNSIAQDIAREFYQYGLSLQHKERKTDDIPKEPSLSETDKAKLDEWFLGSEAYYKRLARFRDGPTNDQIENTRKKLLSVYFGALSRVGHKAEGDKPWKTTVGPMQNLQDKTRRQITKAIETPEREMKSAIFRRGVEKLVTEMRESKDMYDKRTGIKTPGWKGAVNAMLEKFGFDPIIQQRKLYDSLHINELKQELEEVRRTGDVATISAKELQFARTIHAAVSSFPYESDSNNPSEMVETQFINCVGSSILGGGLLDEVGINYLQAAVPHHSATVLITSDGKAYWQDFTPPYGSEHNFQEITSENLEESTDLSNLAHIQDGGLILEFKHWESGDEKLRATLFPPEIGLQCQVLNNAGIALEDLGRHQEAIEAYQQAINIEPNFAVAFYGLGRALNMLGRHQEAIEAYQQAINIDPKDAYPFNGLGNVLKALGRHQEAIEAYQQAINIDPKFALPYNELGRALENLGRHQEAIEAYQQAINIDPIQDSVFYNLGFLYKEIGQYEQAIKALQRHNEIIGDKNSVWVERAEEAIQEMQT